MLNVIKLSKAFGIETILDDVSFTVNPGDRVGLVGANGSGKTTLLRIIGGADRADSGIAALDKSVRVGLLRQGLEPEAGQTVGDAVRAGLAGWEAARAEVDALADRMASESGDALARVM